MEELSVKTILDLVDVYLQSPNIIIHKFDDNHILARRIDDDGVIFHYLDHSNGEIATSIKYSLLAHEQNWFDQAIKETGLVLSSRDNSLKDRLINSASQQTEFLKACTPDNVNDSNRIYLEIINRQAEKIKSLNAQISKLRDELYDDLPTGRNIDAFNLIKIINNHIKSLDNIK